MANISCEAPRPTDSVISMLLQSEATWWSTPTKSCLPSTKEGKRFVYGGEVLLNMHEHLTVGDILNFGAGFSEVMKSFLLYLDEEGVGDFIKNIDQYVAKPKSCTKISQTSSVSKRWTHGMPRRMSVLERQSWRSGSVFATSSMKAKACTPLHPALVEDVFDHLKQGKTVIIDLSLKDNMDAGIISTILVRQAL